MSSADVCAVILAGGQSSRMGFNKALLEIDGQPLIRILINRIRPLTEHILISSNDSSCYGFLDFPVVRDYFMGHGPLAGFHSAMIRSECSLFIIVACDLPNLREHLLRNLLLLVDGFDAAIPRTKDGLHPLCAVYRKTCFPFIERALQRGEKRVINAILDEALSIKWVDPAEGQFEDLDVANINSPEDLRKMKLGSGTEFKVGSIYSSQSDNNPDIL